MSIHRTFITLWFLCTALAAQPNPKSDGITASDIVAQAHEALGNILRAEAAIRTDQDLESFKSTRSKSIEIMTKLAAETSTVKPPTNYERREIYGIAMRYRYELFPPTANGDLYLEEVPKKYHDELRKLGNEQPPDVAKLWTFIAEITKLQEENGFQIPLGSEQIEQNLSVRVALGKGQERPKLAVDPSTLQTRFAEPAEYIVISVEASEVDRSLVLYSQKFAISDDYDASKFQLTDAIRIDKDARTLEILLPGVRHTYKLPAKRQQAAAGQPSTDPKSKPEGDGKAKLDPEEHSK